MSPGSTRIVPLCTTALCIWLAACGSASETAKAPSGLHALVNDSLVRIEGPAEWERETWDERQDLDPDVAFVVFDRAISSGGSAASRDIRLERVAYVRAHITPDGSQEEPSGPARWQAPGLADYRIPVDVAPYREMPDAVMATPRRPLEPGLYAIRARTGGRVRTARIGVDWDDVDVARYVSQYCVRSYDRPDGDTGYLRCTQAPVEQAFELEIEPPVRQTILGSDVLVVVGTVRNVTDEPQPVPDITVRIRDDGGSMVDQRSLTPPVAVLGPHQSTKFREIVDNPPDDATDVQLDFVYPRSAAAR